MDQMWSIVLTQLLIGHLEPWCAGDPISLGGGSACLPLAVDDLDGNEHWYKPAVGKDKGVPDLSWKGKIKSVKFVKTYRDQP